MIVATDHWSNPSNGMTSLALLLSCLFYILSTPGEYLTTSITKTQTSMLLFLKTILIMLIIIMKRLELDTAWHPVTTKDYVESTPINKFFHRLTRVIWFSSLLFSLFLSLPFLFLSLLFSLPFIMVTYIIIGTRMVYWQYWSSVSTPLYSVILLLVY